MKILIMLIGLPGSGKSTTAKELLKVHKTASYVNQDAFDGNRNKAWDFYKCCLELGNVVILDRCNINRTQRRAWINSAQQRNYRVEAIHLHVDHTVAISRIMSRKGHMTIKENTSLEKITEIVQGFNKSFEPPSMYEGFDHITCWRND